MSTHDHDNGPDDRADPTATARKQSAEPEDFSIYLSMDGIRASAPWRIAAYGDDGALSEADLKALAERFDLPEPVLQRMSRELGYCLDEESEVTLVEVNKRIAVDRAVPDLETAAGKVRRVEADLRAIEAILAPLSHYFAENKADANLLASAQARAGQLREAASELYKAIDRVTRTPGAAADMAPRDKRKVWDKRRQYVVETCCHAWRDAGRALTYSTRADTPDPDRRRGALVEFIQAIVAKVTDPPRELSGETLRKDIDRFKARLAQPDPVSVPPETG